LRGRKGGRRGELFPLLSRVGERGGKGYWKAHSEGGKKKKRGGRSLSLLTVSENQKGDDINSSAKRGKKGERGCLFSIFFLKKKKKSSARADPKRKKKRKEGPLCPKRGGKSATSVRGVGRKRGERHFDEVEGRRGRDERGLLSSRGRKEKKRGEGLMTCGEGEEKKKSVLTLSTGRGEKEKC